MRRAAVVAALLVMVSAAPAQAAPVVGVRVDPVSRSQVGRDFAGFSYEKDRVGARMFNALMGLLLAASVVFVVA